MELYKSNYTNSHICGVLWSDGCFGIVSIVKSHQVVVVIEFCEYEFTIIVYKNPLSYIQISLQNMITLND